MGGESQSARGPRFLPVGEKCHRVEREGGRSMLVFTKWDIIQSLREGQPGGYWPVAPTSSTSFRRMDPPLSPRPTPGGDQPVEQNTSFMEAITQTSSPAMSGVELTRPVTRSDKMEEENQYILVVTALKGS